MLRRIEVDNFRSLLHFRLDIPASYLCIVGDNNVGKSNIVTALKWLFDPALANRNMPSVDLSRTTADLEVHIAADVEVIGASLRASNKQRKFIGNGDLLHVGRRFVFAHPVASPLTLEVHRDYAAPSSVEVCEGGPHGNGRWTVAKSLDRFLPQLVHIRPSDIGRSTADPSAGTATASSEELLLQLLWPPELTDDDRQWVEAQVDAIMVPAVPFIHPNPGIRVHEGTGKLMYVDEYGCPIPLYKAGSGIVQIAYTLLRIALARRRSFRRNHQELLFFIDEPEQHLASGMQKSYADFLVGLSRTHQIIVTSHASTFIRRDLVGANCVLIRGNANGTEALQGVGVDVAAIRKTLGISGEDSLYFGEVNVLVEGSTEASALPQLFGRLHQAGKLSFRPEQVTWINCESIDKVIQFAKVFTNIGLGVVILVDNENKTAGVERQLQRDVALSATARLLKIPLAGTLREAEFEDLFPRRMLIEAVDEHVRRRHQWQITEEDLQEFYAAQSYHAYKKWGDCLAGILLAKGYITNKDQVDEMVSKPAVVDAVIMRLAVEAIPEFIASDLAQAVAEMIAIRPHPLVTGMLQGVVPPSRNVTWLHEINLATTIDHDW